MSTATVQFVEIAREHLARISEKEMTTIIRYCGGCGQITEQVMVGENRLDEMYQCRNCHHIIFVRVR